jgi:hypothetical protein
VRVRVQQLTESEENEGRPVISSLERAAEIEVLALRAGFPDITH